MTYMFNKQLMLMTSCTALFACAETPKPETADLILTDAYVYTVDDQRSVAEAIALKGNKILAVGNAAEVLVHKGDTTEVRDLDGKMVMPGLHDMHIHALGSVTPDMCDLGSTTMTLDALVPVIKACVDKYTKTEDDWLPVLQWNPFEGNQPSAQYPTIRAALDAASSTHPIILWGNDGHHGAANTAALNSPDIPINAGTLKTTYADYKVLIAVDESGEPTGGMTEGARNIVRANMDNDMLGVSTARENLMPRVAAMMASRGITSLQDAAVTEDVLDHYLWLDKAGGMTFRLRTALLSEMEGHKAPSTNDDVTAMIEAAVALREKANGAHYIRANAIKLFADGVLEGNPYADPPTMPNAAMIDGFHQPIFKIDPETEELSVESYVDLDSALCKQVQENPSAFEAATTIATFKAENGYLPLQCIKHYGTLEAPEDILKAFVMEATKAGFHVHIHAVADHAVKVAADAFEASKATADKGGLTQSVAHIQIAKTEDIERLGKLGAYVAFTYIWATPEPAYEMVVVPFFDKIHGHADLYDKGNYYTSNAYPFKTTLMSGGHPVFGSDTPVGSRDPRPFKSMKIALTRQSGDIVLNADERLDIHEVIASYTRTSAGMMARTHELGTLEPGKLADLIVLDRNIIELAEQGDTETLGDANVLTTIFDGKIVYEAP